MNRYFLLVVGLAVWVAQAASAQSKPDYQLRIPVHFQVASAEDSQTKSRVGFAGWVVLPNVMAANNRTALLVVGGILWRQGPGGKWVEFMGGSRFNQQDGYFDPLLNIRFSNNNPRGVNLYGETGYFFREIRRRFYALVAVDVLLPIGQSGMRLGFESENTYFPSKPNSWGIGPRLVIPLPALSPFMKASVTTAFQCFRTDRAFVRTYITINAKNP